jgi:hypothetical protein
VQRVILIVTKIFIKVILSQKQYEQALATKQEAESKYVFYNNSKKSNSFPNISYKAKKGFR